MSYGKKKSGDERKMSDIRCSGVGKKKGQTRSNDDVVKQKNTIMYKHSTQLEVG